MLLRALSECRFATCHCHQSAAVDLVPHHGVVSMHLFEQLPTLLLNSGRETTRRLVPLRTVCPPICIPDRLRPDHLDDFKHQLERKQREVSEPVCGHQDKGLPPFKRQALEFQHLR
jgi:hypothetical protein